jgi:hypothetical protein
MPILLTGKFNPSGGAGAFKLYDAADVQQAVISKTGVYTATVVDDIILCNGTFTINLYTAIGYDGNLITIKNIGTGTVTVDAFGTQTIDGSLTAALPVQYTSLTLTSDGSNWNII